MKIIIPKEADFWGVCTFPSPTPLLLELFKGVRPDLFVLAVMLSIVYWRKRKNNNCPFQGYGFENAEHHSGSWKKQKIKDHENQLPHIGESYRYATLK